MRSSDPSCLEERGAGLNQLRYITTGRSPSHDDVRDGVRAASAVLEHQHTKNRIAEGDNALDAELLTHSLQIGGKHIERQIVRIAG